MFRVLLPLDTDEDRAVRQAQVAASLPHAREDVEVTLIHVFPSEEMAEKTTVQQLVAGRAARDYLTDHHVTVRMESRFGDPASEILNAAADVDADLIVLGGRKQSRLGSLLFGSVSREVTLHATRPVTITGGVQPAAERRLEEMEAREGDERSTAHEDAEGIEVGDDSEDAVA